jgi:hypothetical protein
MNGFLSLLIRVPRDFHPRRRVRAIRCIVLRDGLVSCILKRSFTELVLCVLGAMLIVIASILSPTVWLEAATLVGLASHTAPAPANTELGWRPCYENMVKCVEVASPEYRGDPRLISNHGFYNSATNTVILCLPEGDTAYPCGHY